MISNCIRKGACANKSGEATFVLFLGYKREKRCKRLLNKLVSITIIIIRLLINEWESGRMNLSDFSTHIHFKLKFLKEHENEICQSNLRFLIPNTIKLCDEILGISNI